MSNRDTKLLLDDILQSALKIKRYTGLMDINKLVKDDKTLDAVIRNFEIISEAANRIDTDFKNKNPQIEWNRIRGFRNRIVHDYFGIDYEIVWDIIENYLEQLIVDAQSIIKEN